MRRLRASLALAVGMSFVLAGAACAQSAVQQVGPVTPGDYAVWWANGQISDGGSATAQPLAQSVVTGYLTTSGCPSGQTTCFVQYGPTQQPPNPATIYSSQQTVTTSAAALPTKVLVNGIVLTAASGNSAPIFVGPSTVAASGGNIGYSLAPGASISYGVSNLNAVYIISAASTTDTVSFTGN